MNLVYTLLLAFPIGYLVTSRSTAVLGYLAGGSYLLSLQSTWVLLSWLGHESRPAFGPFPEGFPAQSSTSEIVGYGVVNLVITLVGVGLVLLGRRVAGRRRTRSNDVVAVA